MSEEQNVFASEAVLMRTCGHLYVSIALESLATTLMCTAFGYLLLLITSKGRLQSPGKAAYQMVTSNVSAFYKELSQEVSHWSEMAGLPLERRFALCRKTNQAICMFQILIGVLTIERWLHINNVNGFRYLGYSVTCPPMQTQLVILIAPKVPCFRLNCVLTYIITTSMLLLGYAASVIPGTLYTGDFDAFWGTWDFDILQPTTKGWLTLIACAAQVYLSFLQIPILALIYYSSGGVRAGLPNGYIKLLGIVALTWLAFPVWWVLSFEGMSYITDTKMNAAGFALLNVCSKGSFTMQMLEMVKWHRREKKRQECLEQGRRPSQEEMTSVFETDEEAGEQVQRKDRRSETWVVRMLRPYDIGEAPHQWLDLEATYRAFLVGNGVTPSSWLKMDMEQRAQLRQEYAASFGLVAGEEAPAGDAHPSACGKVVCKGAPGPKFVEDAPPMPPSEVPTAMRRGVSPNLKAEPEASDGADSTSGGPSSGSFGRPASEPPKVRVGQTVTTAQGLKGRVVRVTGKGVQLAVPGRKRPQLVNTDDLTLLKVIFLGGHGFRGAERTGKMKLFCSCLVHGRPSSEVYTPAEPAASKASWEHEVDLLGCSPGDSVEIRLWGKDPKTQSDHLLGEATMPAAQVSEGGFEDELQLNLDGKSLPTYLSIMVVAVNMPHDGEDANEEDEEMGLPVARPAKLKGLNEHVTADGKTVCCF